MVLEKIKFPEWSMAYIHNGEMDTITEEEIKLIEDYIKFYNIHTVGMPTEEPYFSAPPMFSGFLADNYYDIECLINE